MPVVHETSAPTYSFTEPGLPSQPGIPHISVVSYAVPSTGAKETCVWRITFAPWCPARPGIMDHEGIYVVLSGNGIMALNADEHQLATGDCMIVPRETTFTIENPHDEPLEIMEVLPVGTKIGFEGEEPFVPPWAR